MKKLMFLIAMFLAPSAYACDGLDPYNTLACASYFNLGVKWKLTATKTKDNCRGRVNWPSTFSEKLRMDSEETWSQAEFEEDNDVYYDDETTANFLYIAGRRLTPPVIFQTNTKPTRFFGGLESEDSQPCRLLYYCDRRDYVTIDFSFKRPKKFTGKLDFFVDSFGSTICEAHYKIVGVHR